MPLNRQIEERAAKVQMPPAAAAAAKLAENATIALTDMDDAIREIGNMTSVAPHDRLAIIGMVDTFKKKLFTLYGQAVETHKAMKEGR